MKRSASFGIRMLSAIGLAIAWTATPLTVSAQGSPPDEIDRMIEEFMQGLDPEARDFFRRSLQEFSRDDRVPFPAAQERADPGRDRMPPRSQRQDRLVPPELMEDLFDELMNQANGERRRHIDRDRQPGPFEKLDSQQLTRFKPLLARTSQSTAALLDGDRLLSLATIVSADGWLIAKASELEEADALRCVLPDGESLEAEIVETRADHDLALIRVDRQDLTPIEWTQSETPVGSLVVSGDQLGLPFAWGVVSVEPRVLIESNQAVLGVIPQPAVEGIVISLVQPDSAADAAGLRVGDIVLSINGSPITTVNSLANTIRLYDPGDTISLKIRRDNQEETVEAVLAGRNVSAAFSQSLQVMNQFGSEPSRRNSDFPLVLQHDTPLWPEQCGGPLVDLDGRAIGVNIARGGRVASYAIPAAVVQDVLDEWGL